MNAVTTAAVLLKRLESFPWQTWNKSLGKGLSQPYRDLVLVTMEKVVTGLGADFTPLDPLLDKFMTGYVLERAVQINATTKEQLADLIRSTFADPRVDKTRLGDLVKDKMREKVEGYEAWRAERIARTETAIAYNHANVLGFSQADIEEVEVLDGTDDDLCADANGEIWSLRQALSNPIAHPNCVRVFVPIVREEEAHQAQERFELDDKDLSLLCALSSELITARDDPCSLRMLDPIEDDDDEKES